MPRGFVEPFVHFAFCPENCVGCAVRVEWRPYFLDDMGCVDIARTGREEKQQHLCYPPGVGMDKVMFLGQDGIYESDGINTIRIDRAQCKQCGRPEAPAVWLK